MKTVRPITESVLAANRANSKSSTGPRTERGKQNANQNARRHGILAKKIAFETDEERAEFHALAESCIAEFNPEGLVQEVLVEEITTCLWKIQIAVGLEVRELSSRHNLRDRIRGVFHGDVELPIDAEAYPLDRGWDCDRLIVRAVAGQNVDNSSSSRGPAIVQNQTVRDYQSTQSSDSHNRGHLEVEAVLGNALTNITRYESGFKHDFYKAIEILRALQAKKRGPEVGDC